MTRITQLQPQVAGPATACGTPTIGADIRLPTIGPLRDVMPPRSLGVESRPGGLSGGRDRAERARIDVARPMAPARRLPHGRVRE